MGFRNPVTSVAGAAVADVATKALTVDTRASSTAAGVRAYNVSGRNIGGQIGSFTRGVVELYDGQNPTAPTFLSAENVAGKVAGTSVHRSRWSDGGHPSNSAALPAYLEFSYDDGVTPPVSTAILHAAEITLDGATNTPRGLIAYAVSSSPVTGISTATRLTTAPISSVALTPDRCYVYVVEARTYSTVAADVAAVAGRLTPTGSTPAATDTALGAATAVCGIAGTADLYPLTVWHPFQVGGSSPTYQVNLWGSRAAGTGLVAITNTAAGDYFHGIIDVGPALPTILPSAI
jgi:hypothetical protein